MCGKGKVIIMQCTTDCPGTTLRYTRGQRLWVQTQHLPIIVEPWNLLIFLGIVVVGVKTKGIQQIISMVVIEQKRVPFSPRLHCWEMAYTPRIHYCCVCSTETECFKSKTFEDSRVLVFNAGEAEGELYSWTFPPEPSLVSFESNSSCRLSE